MKLVTAQQMQEIDRRTIEGGLVPAQRLMENAGAAVAAEALCLLPRPRGARVEIVCGKGNNGGDGLVVARLLAAQGVRVGVHLAHAAAEASPESRANLRRLRGTDVEVHALPASLPAPTSCIDATRRPDRAPAAPTYPAARARTAARRLSCEDRLRRADLCIDALLGTGAARVLTPRYSALVGLLNQHSRRTLAVDVPSGIDASTGAILGTAVWADVTVTFGLPKLGLAFHPGRERCGRLVVADIGFPPAVLATVPSSWSWVEATWARRLLPCLVPTAHKYARGTLLVIAGSRPFPGAAALAAEAALRAGAGMVHLVVPGSIRDLLEIQLREVIVHSCPETDDGIASDGVLEVIAPLLGRCDAVALGSGIPAGPPVRDWMRRLLGQLTLPAVVDADAIQALPAPPHPAARVVTPHAGELARWIECDGRIEANDRVEKAAGAAARHDVVVLAKGAPTVVISPDGTRRVNGSGHAGLATAGSGDVLSGIVGSLLAQRVAASDAAALGAYLHGLAAEMACRGTSPRSLIAGDLLASIGTALHFLENP